MTIKELIPAVVEDIAAAVDDCRARGLNVIAPEAVDLELQAPLGTKVSVRLRVMGPELRDPPEKGSEG